MTSIGAQHSVDERVRRVFEDTLAVSAPAPDAELLDSGLLDSLAIVRLIVALEAEFEVEVPLERLNLADVRTIASIAQLVVNVDSDDDPVPTGLVRLRNGHEGRPVFIFPGVAGEALGMLALTRRMQTDRPVHGLEAWGAPSRRGQPATVEQRAEASLRAIRSVQPTGPVSLIGFSFGGLVAYEVARVLRDRGEPVELLVLIDTNADVRVLRRTAQLRYRIGQPWRYARNVLSDPLHRIPHYLQRLRSRTQRPELPAVLGHLAVEDELGVKAVAAYRPGHYGGDAVLFAATEDNPADCPPQTIWQHLVDGALTIRMVPSHHSDILARTAGLLASEVDALVGGVPTQERP